MTRAKTQSADITSLLEARGALVIHCPTIEVIPPDSWAELDDSINRLREYDWIVFTSANGVRFFFQRLSERQIDPVDSVEGRKICVIGPATARASLEAGFEADVTASDSKSEGALKTILDHLGGASYIEGLKFLIPRAKVARDVLPSGLRELGARVDTVETYQTVKPVVAGKEVVSLLEGGSIDAITFTSSSTVSNFADLVGLKDLSGLLSNTLVACIGPVTAVTAAEFGLKDTIQPEQYNATALVEAIVGRLGRD